MAPLLIASAAFSVAGTLWGNKAKAEQEAQNAWFYRKQAEFAQAATRRELSLAADQFARTKGLQISALAKGGADVGSGSASALLAMTAAKSLETIEAIKLKGELDFTLASARADASQGLADTFSDPTYNLLTGAAAAMPSIAQGVK